MCYCNCTKGIEMSSFKAFKFLKSILLAIYTITFISFPHISTANELQTTNISHILFGMAGSLKTWSNRSHYSELWWKPNVTRGFVWMDDTPLGMWPETFPPYKVSADTSRFKYTSWYGSRSAVRITRIVKESFELGLENVRWFVMGDDDTVFFTDNLVTVLAKYDHNQMYYIGGNSESVEQDVIYSYSTAFGGGGFAISYPLAAELVRILDGCIDRYAILYGGDQKIQACISEIGVPITREFGFHQVDIRGNIYGFLAAHPVAPLVSLHHVDYLKSIFPNLTRIDSFRKLFMAYEMDPSRILQQSFCYDFQRKWSVSVSWGYTVQLYPSLLTVKQLETAFLTFQTWGSLSNGPFTFNTRPMSSDSDMSPVVYFLDRVERLGEGNTTTTYRRYTPSLAVQFVNVSAFNFSPDLWRKVSKCFTQFLLVSCHS
ncbi:Transferring glycosyl group transferase [Quillaja saponaria]|uniref:Transferring glycosyl group transferase n=1 Tax=Quillaja saponaria TaxID=32244 RepID=A0AAD7L269_QUISA|nr:Transferring glycosyl group transferase [Quillaja saponaria]